MRLSDWSSDVCSSDLLAMLSYQGTYSLVAGVDPGPQGAMHDSIPTYRSFKARDGRELVVTANTAKMWQGLCRSLDLSDLAGDERFSSASARLTHREELWRLLADAFRENGAVATVQNHHCIECPAALAERHPEAIKERRTAVRDG